MTVGVLGVGVMGIGIVQCLAVAGCDVVAVDPAPAALASAPTRLRDGLRLATLLRGRGAAGQPADAPARVRWTAQLRDLEDVEFVIECAPERIPVKSALFRELDEVCRPTAILASCTSAIPIAALAGHTARPNRVVGMHFMNPAPLKPAVEVIRAPATSDETMARVASLLGRIGKRPIVVGDAPGFVTNRILMSTINQAIAVVHAGTADAATVDEIFRECFGHPMGPLRTADLIGLDTVLDSLVVLGAHTGDPVFQPCQLLLDLVATGRLGTKSGHGFYLHPGPATR